MTISLLRKHAKTNSSSFWEALAVFFWGFSNMKRLWKMKKTRRFTVNATGTPEKVNKVNQGSKTPPLNPLKDEKKRKRHGNRKKQWWTINPRAWDGFYNIWFYWSGVAVIRWEYTMQGYPLWISKDIIIIYDKSNEIDHFRAAVFRQIVVFLRQWNTPCERSGIRGAPHRN